MIQLPIGRRVAPQVESASDCIDVMAIPARSKGGRRSKGPRRMLTVRPPENLADAIIEAADAEGSTINDYIVRTLAQVHGYPLAALDDPDQRALPLGA